MIGKEKWNDSIITQIKYTHPWNHTDIIPYYPLWFKGFLGETRGVWKESPQSNNKLIRLTPNVQKNVNSRKLEIEHKNEDSENITILEMNVNQSC